MALMPDEQYVMISDSIEKKKIAHSSHNHKTHCGKGGRVKFPSDYLSKKELKAMNGEVKSYNLNIPMTWEEFRSMPQDIQVMYIKKLRNEFGVPDKNIAEMMGVTRSSFCKAIKDLGLSMGSAASHESKKWDGTEDQKRFYSWCGFYQKTVEEITEESTEEEAADEESDIYENTNDEEFYTEVFHPPIPTGGRMSFDCRFEDAIKVLEPILTGNRVRLNIDWIVVKEDL